MKRLWTKLRREDTPRSRRNSTLRSLRIEKFEERRVMDGSFAGLDELIGDTTPNIHVISVRRSFTTTER